MFLSTIQKGDKEMVNKSFNNGGKPTTNMAMPKKQFKFPSRMMISSYCTAFMLTLFSTVSAFANGGNNVVDTSTISEILGNMISVVGTIFTAVGIILAVYSVGQLILAFKNEDPDSKSRASTLLVVAIILIAFPAIVEGLDLTSYL